MNCPLVFIIFLFLISPVNAEEVSLINRDEIPASEPSSASSISKGEVSKNNNHPQQDDFDQMDDFIKKENEKLRDIKLLNLDLERANLELKRREIERKMAQLDGTREDLHSKKQEEAMSRPFVKLSAIFEVGNKKQALLSINGIHINAKEGENREGFVVKAIREKEITIQYRNGEIQELYLL